MKHFFFFTASTPRRASAQKKVYDDDYVDDFEDDDDDYVQYSKPRKPAARSPRTPKVGFSDAFEQYVNNRTPTALPSKYLPAKRSKVGCIEMLSKMSAAVESQNKCTILIYQILVIIHFR